MFSKTVNFSKRLKNRLLRRGSLDAAIRHRSFDSMMGILGWILSLTKSEFSDFTLKKRKALEIGTGIFCTHALGLYICGCDKVVTVDKYKQLSARSMKLAVSNTILARRFLSPHVSHDDFISRLQQIRKTGYDMQKLKAIGVEYLAPLDLIDSEEIKETFHFLFSYTVMEHVPPAEVTLLLKKSIELMDQGSYCAHFIDMEDHRNPQINPFDFLSGNVVWEDSECFSRGNRQRFSSWKNILAEQRNMDWRYPYVAVRHDLELPSDIDNNIDYTDETDLRTTAFVAVGRKIS